MENVKNVFGLVAFILFLLFILLWLIGCLDYESPECRYEDHIERFTVNGRPYDSVVLNEHGGPVLSTADCAVQFCYHDGTPIEVGGLRAEVLKEFGQYYTWSGEWWPTEEAGVGGNGITNESGFAVFTMWCELWGTRKTQSGVTVKGRYTDITGLSAEFTNARDPRTGYNTLIPWYEYTGGPPYYIGGHYLSKTPAYQAVNAWDIEPQTAGSSVNNLPAYQAVNAGDIEPQTAGSSVNNLSEDDVFFLNMQSTEPPSVGIEVSEATWCMRAGADGCGYSKPIANLHALSHSDPNIIKDYSTPYFLTLHVLVSEALEEDYFPPVIPATLSVGTDFEEAIECRTVAVSDDRQRLIVQSDYIVPIRADDYTFESPLQAVRNRWTEGGDPNALLDVWCVLVEQGQTINIQFEKDAATLLSFSEYWLSDNKNADINEDGIINLIDVF